MYGRHMASSDDGTMLAIGMVGDARIEGVPVWVVDLYHVVMGKPKLIDRLTGQCGEGTPRITDLVMADYGQRLTISSSTGVTTYHIWPHGAKKRPDVSESYCYDAKVAISSDGGTIMASRTSATAYGGIASRLGIMKPHEHPDLLPRYFKSVKGKVRVISGGVSNDGTTIAVATTMWCDGRYLANQLAICGNCGDIRKYPVDTFSPDTPPVLSTGGGTVWLSQGAGGRSINIYTKDGKSRLFMLLPDNLTVVGRVCLSVTQRYLYIGVFDASIGSTQVWMVSTARREYTPLPNKIFGLNLPYPGVTAWSVGTSGLYMLSGDTNMVYLEKTTGISPLTLSSLRSCDE